MPNGEDVKADLEAHFPDYSFFNARRISGRCIVAKKSKYCGADIYVKVDRVVIEAAIPEWKTRFMLGAGAALKRVSDPHYFDAAEEVTNYLRDKYRVELRK